MQVFIYSTILLFFAILLLTGSLPLQAIVFVLLIEIFSPYLEVTAPVYVQKLVAHLLNLPLLSWSSVEKSVLMSLFF